MSTDANSVQEAIGIELFHADGKPAGIAYCSKCRIVFKTKAEAGGCCGERLCECGKPVGDGRKFYSQCRDCEGRDWRERCAKQEADRFEKTTKVKASEWAGEQVYVEPDHYYETVEDALDGYLDGHEPEYVWAAKNVGLPKADIDGIIEHLLSEAWEDASVDDLYGVEDLEAAIDGFNKVNAKVICWMPDYSTAILVEKAEPTP